LSNRQDINRVLFYKKKKKKKKREKVAQLELIYLFVLLF